jgi:phosphoglycerate dehydrogenase-like enzyme
MFPARQDLTICFAHAAYQMQARFNLRKTGIQNFQVWNYDDFQKRVGEADVVVVSGMWKNDLIPSASKLKFIQSISSGMDQYSREQLAAKSVRLCSAAGVNARAVAEHAIALILAGGAAAARGARQPAPQVLARMIGDLTQREDELGGKTMLVVGMGRIGSHLATLGKAFGMKVIGIRQDPGKGSNGARCDPWHGDLVKLVPQADIVALNCALTPETTGLMSAAAFAAMKPSGVFVNVARGKVADESALIATHEGGQDRRGGDRRYRRGAAARRLAAVDDAQCLHHAAHGGRDRAYEDNVIDILIENLERLGKATRFYAIRFFNRLLLVVPVVPLSSAASLSSRLLGLLLRLPVGAAEPAAAGRR